MNMLLVAIGGFIGSICRYAISLKMNKRIFATWIANLTGSMFLAFLLKFYKEGIISDAIWLFLGVGFCGAYTTFSTFGNETLILFLEKSYWKAISYVLSSILFTLGAVFVVLEML